MALKDFAEIIKLFLKWEQLVNILRKSFQNVKVCETFNFDILILLFLKCEGIWVIYIKDLMNFQN
jgi:hypothetical protein